MNSIEAYIQYTPGLVDDEFRVTDPRTEEFLRRYMEEFHMFVARVYTVFPRNA